MSQPLASIARIEPLRTGLCPNTPRRSGVANSLAGVVVALLVGHASGETTLSLDPKRTYLHTSSSDPAMAAEAIELASLGFAPGDRIEIHRLGDFDNGPGSDVFTNMVAVFSGSSVLLPASALHRVPDAIAAGVAVNTGTTHFGGEPTDIPEDFGVSLPWIPEGRICVVVPRGATHIFVSPLDSHFSDNADGDGNWGVRFALLDSCAADLDGDGSVGGADLGLLLSNWGAQQYGGAPGDLNCDGAVDGADLGLLLSGWGGC